jgi:4-amino-4-deoxy-L-arabinose transferase-like glycosyltransferase
MSDPSRLRERNNLATFVAAALVMLICLLSHLGAMGLVGPDEPRYAWIARAMATSGDWVTPRLYGQPWFEKPILYYWAAGVGFLMHFPAEWAARLPSALAAIVAAGAIGWLGWKYYGANAELLGSPFLVAPLIFSTTVGAIGFARAAAPDMLFAASLTLAMANAASSLCARGALRSSTDVASRGTGSDYLALALLGVWIGLAVLAKGPAGIVLAGGAIGLWTLATGRWRDAIWLAHPIAIGTFCIVALPWYILCTLRNPNFVRVFIFQHNFERYLAPIFQHRQPFWYFLPIGILALLPWTVCLWPAAQEGLRLWRARAWNNSPGFYFVCWATFPPFFFSFSQSKLPGYILPAIPPLALLIGIGICRSVLSPTSRAANAPADAFPRSVLPALGVTWIALCLSAAHWVNRLPEGARDVPGKTILDGAMIGAGVGIVIAALGLRRRRGAMLLTIFMVMISVEAVGRRVLPALDPYISARFHGNMLRNDRYPNRVFTLHLTRSWQYGLNFYLEREVPEWSPTDRGPALVLTTPLGLEEIRKLGRVQGALDEPYAGLVFVPVLPVATAGGANAR